MAADSRNQYFAVRPKADIGKAIADKLMLSHNGSNTAQRKAAYSAAYSAYYGFDAGAGSTFSVERGGEAGELAKVRVNKARVVLRALLGLVTGAPITWRAEARNGGTDARSSVLLAQNLLEFQWKQGGLRQAVMEWAETGLALSEGFVLSLWNDGAGASVGLEGAKDAVGLEGAKEVNEGDLERHIIMPWDLFRDPKRKSWKRQDWLCARLPLNKWDLWAQYPKDILGVDTEGAILSAGSGETMPRFDEGDVNPTESDTVDAYYWFHKSTPSVPQGRMVLMVGGGCVLVDDVLEGNYPRIPITRFAPEEQLDTAFGYTSWWDALGIQEEYDGLHSAVASNQLALATQGIAQEEGTNADYDSVHNLKVYVYPKGSKPPVALQLTASPPEVFEHMKSLAADQRDLCGLNDVAMGQPDTAQMNAEAFALLASMAVQRNKPVQSSLLDAVGELGKLELAILSERVTEPRKLAIAGRQAVSTARDWKGKELKPIDAVIVTVGGALEQHPGGRLQMVQLYLAAGMKLSPDEIQQVVETGRLEQATEEIRDELLLIGGENDELSRGEVPPVHALHDHLTHFRKHRCVILVSEALDDAKVLEAVQAHQDWHYREYWGLPEQMIPQEDPQYLVRVRIMAGQQPPAMMPMGPGAAPPGAAPGPTGEPPLQAPGSEVAPSGADVPTTLPPQPEVMNG